MAGLEGSGQPGSSEDSGRKPQTHHEKDHDQNSPTFLTGHASAGGRNTPSASPFSSYVLQQGQSVSHEPFDQNELPYPTSSSSRANSPISGRPKRPESPWLSQDSGQSKSKRIRFRIDRPTQSPIPSNAKASNSSEQRLNFSDISHQDAAPTDRVDSCDDSSQFSTSSADEYASVDDRDRNISRAHYFFRGNRRVKPNSFRSRRTYDPNYPTPPHAHLPPPYLYPSSYPFPYYHYQVPPPTYFPFRSPPRRRSSGIPDRYDSRDLENPNDSYIVYESGDSHASVESHSSKDSDDPKNRTQSSRARQRYQSRNPKSSNSHRAYDSAASSDFHSSSKAHGTSNRYGARRRSRLADSLDTSEGVRLRDRTPQHQTSSTYAFTGQTLPTSSHLARDAFDVATVGKASARLDARRASNAPAVRRPSFTPVAGENSTRLGLGAALGIPIARRGSNASAASRTSFTPGTRENSTRLGTRPASNMHGDVVIAQTVPHQRIDEDIPRYENNQYLNFGRKYIYDIKLWSNEYEFPDILRKAGTFFSTQNSISGRLPHHDSQDYSTERLQILQNYYVSQVTEASHGIAQLTSNKVDTFLGEKTSDEQFKWLHVKTQNLEWDDFKELGTRLSGLHSAQRSLVTRLLDEVIKTCKKRTAKVSYLCPTVMQFNGETIHDVKRGKSESAMFVCLPYFSLEALETRKKSLFQSRPLLNTRYHLESAERIDEHQIIRQLKKGEDCIHVPQIWLIISSGLMITCSSLNLQEMGKNFVNIRFADSLDKSDIGQKNVKFTDIDGKSYFFNCQTWFELLETIAKADHLSSISSTDVFVANRYRLLTLEETPVTDKNWKELLDAEKGPIQLFGDYDPDYDPLDSIFEYRDFNNTNRRVANRRKSHAFVKPDVDALPIDSYTKAAVKLQRTESLPRNEVEVGVQVPVAEQTLNPSSSTSTQSARMKGKAPEQRIDDMANSSRLSRLDTYAKHILGDEEASTKEITKPNAISDHVPAANDIEPHPESGSSSNHQYIKDTAQPAFVRYPLQSTTHETSTEPDASTLSESSANGWTLANLQGESTKCWQPMWDSETFIHSRHQFHITRKIKKTKPWADPILAWPVRRTKSRRFGDSKGHKTTESHIQPAKPSLHSSQEPLRSTAIRYSPLQDAERKLKEFIRRDSLKLDVWHTRQAKIKDFNFVMVELNHETTEELLKTCEKLTDLISVILDIMEAFIPPDSQAPLTAICFGALLSLISLVDHRAELSRLNSYFQHLETQFGENLAIIEEIHNGVLGAKSAPGPQYFLPGALLKAFQEFLVFLCSLTKVKGGFRSVGLTNKKANEFGNRLEKQLEKAKEGLILMVHTGTFDAAEIYREVNVLDVGSLLMESLLQKLDKESEYQLLEIYREYMSNLEREVFKAPSVSVFDNIQSLVEELDTVDIITRDQLTVIATCQELYMLNPKYEQHIDSICWQSLNTSKRYLQQQRLEIQELRDLATRRKTLLRHKLDLRKESNSLTILIFTIVTTVFLPLSFVTSYLGMNSVDIRNAGFSQARFWQIGIPTTMVVLVIAWIIVKSKRKLRKGMGRIKDPSSFLKPHSVEVNRAGQLSTRFKNGARHIGAPMFRKARRQKKEADAV